MSFGEIDGFSVRSDVGTTRTNDRGSTWLGAAFNLTSSIVGAGCIGLGGAIANSGGLISIIAIGISALLSKFSLDLVVSLDVESSSQQSTGGEIRLSTYESLGRKTYGETGELIVILSKGFYSMGSLVAYIVIIKDNFTFALSNLIFGYHLDDVESSFLLNNQNLITSFLCLTIMLPLSLLRDLSPLERFSLFKICVLLMIVCIVVALYFIISSAEGTAPNVTVDHWLTFHTGIFESLGTFVFAFVAQNVVHLIFQSLKPSSRNMEEFRKTTTLGIILATLISLGMGLSVYMTFWDKTTSDMFYLYEQSKAVDVCRILLCISILLTYPFPFLTVRELVILVSAKKIRSNNEFPLKQLGEEQPLVAGKTMPSKTTSLNSSWLLPGEERQLKTKYHVILTILLWGISLFLALTATSLGAVLNFTGCTTGTVISYILPALFSYKLHGHTPIGTLLFIFGGVVGSIGTFYSILAFF